MSQTVAPQFSIGYPADLPYFEVHGRLFHALPATGFELDELEKLRLEPDQEADRTVLRRQVEILADVLAERAVVAQEGGFTRDPEPPNAEWFWRTVPLPQLGDLVRQFSKVVGIQPNRASRRKN